MRGLHRLVDHGDQLGASAAPDGRLIDRLLLAGFRPRLVSRGKQRLPGLARGGFTLPWRDTARAFLYRIVPRVRYQNVTNSVTGGQGWRIAKMGTHEELARNAREFWSLYLAQG